MNKVTKTRQQRALELIDRTESGEDIMKPLGERLSEVKRWWIELHELTIQEAERQGAYLLTTANICIHFDINACLRLPKPENSVWLLREATEDEDHSAVIMEDKTWRTLVKMTSGDSIALAMIKAWWSLQP